FFFSSRRRHTSFSRDWSSDVCSSDLPPEPATTTLAKTSDPLVARVAPSLVMVHFDMPYSVSGITDRHYYGTGLIVDAQRGLVARSEERRVGKEGRARG